MTETWFRSETRDVRPFFDAARLDDVLKDAAIRPFRTGTFVEDTTLSLDDADWDRLSITIQPRLDVRVLGHQGLDRSDYKLSLLASQTFLKRSQIVESWPLSEQIPEEIEVPPEVLESLGGGRNSFFILILSPFKDRQRRPGQPYLRSHWLARKMFKLSEQKDVGSFNIEMLDDRGWEGRQLPAKTLYFVQYIGGINQPASDDSKIATLYIHADAHNALTSDARPSNARQVQTILAAEVACQLLIASFPEWESARTVEKKSPLSSILKHISKVRKTDLAGLQKMVKEPGAPVLRALLQAESQTVKSICGR